MKREEAASLVKKKEEIFTFKRKKKGLAEDDSGSGEGVAAPFRDPEESARKRGKKRRGKKVKFSKTILGLVSLIRDAKDALID